MQHPAPTLAAPHLYITGRQPLRPGAILLAIIGELFLPHVAEGAPFRHDFLEGARGVQLANSASNPGKNAAGSTSPS